MTTRRLSLTRTLYQTWGRLYLARVGALAPLQAFVAARDTGAHKPNYADLAYLYRQVLRRHPCVVIEYGSGCSTPIIALALQRTGRGHLLSLESDPAWSAQTWQALPVSMRPWCHVTLSPLTPATVRGVTGYRWEARPPALVPDLIYLDGPGLTPAHAGIQHLPAVDLLELEPRLAVGCRLVVDGRPGTTAFLRQHFRRPWTFRRHHVMDRHVFTLYQGEAP